MMKKRTKKTSVAKRLIPAVGMLAVSASMLATSTYAWFTMNKEVEVTNMRVQVKSEVGLLVNEVATAADGNWDALATSSADTNFTLIPMSTLDGTTWVHANSKAGYDSGKAASATTKGTNLSSDGYKFYTLASAKNGSNLASGQLDFITTDSTAGSQAQIDTYYMENDATAGAIGDTDDGAFVKYSYYLKSSGSADVATDPTSDDTDMDKVYVKSISVSGLDATTKDGATVLSHDLDKTLRVGIKVTDNNDTPNTTFYTFAPVKDADENYFIATADSTFAATADSVQTATSKTLGTLSEGKTTCTATYATGLQLGTLPNTNSNGKLVEVYLWFEGEDTNCKTDNIYSDLNKLTVDITFGLK